MDQTAMAITLGSVLLALAIWLAPTREMGARYQIVADAAAMGTRLGTHALRIAVKDRDGNERVLTALNQCLREDSTRPRRPTPAALV